ncbi:MAG: NINE protein [Rhodospirillales bacterium]|jgi:class 3 adenylate cyclase|nr:NINE protein [Rhodospirillales bacterium]
MADRGVERRLAAILAADVADYTRLMETDEDATIDAWRSARAQIIDPKIASFGGRIVKHTGDGFLAEFPTVQDAVRCAVEMQAELGARNATVADDRRMDFRIGINIGDIAVDDEDIYGDGVNIAARLEGLADPGGICVSGDVYNQVRKRLDLSFEDLGEQRVKNIAEPLVAYLISPPDVRARRRRTREPPVRPKSTPQAVAAVGDGGEVSEKRRLSAIILCLLIGLFGGHRFYLGYKGSAYLQLFTIGGLSLWTLADLVLLLTGELTDGKGRTLKRWL